MNLTILDLKIWFSNCILHSTTLMDEIAVVLILNGLNRHLSILFASIAVFVLFSWFYVNMLFRTWVSP